MCCNEVLWVGGACCPTALPNHSAAVTPHFIIERFTIWTDMKYLWSAGLSIPPLHTHGWIDSLMPCKIYLLFSNVVFHAFLPVLTNVLKVSKAADGLIMFSNISFCTGNYWTCLLLCSIVHLVTYCIVFNMLCIYIAVVWTSVETCMCRVLFIYSVPCTTFTLLKPISFSWYAVKDSVMLKSYKLNWSKIRTTN